jgi:cytidine deaminase
MKLTNIQIKQLINAAKLARKNAIAYRSKHAIGASVLTAQSEIFIGCNIESPISGLGTCAERCAIDNAVVHGSRHILAVCIVDGGVTPPCGMCLQYMMLFSQIAGHDIAIVSADMHGKHEVYSLNKLLPEGYRTNHNLKVLRK